MLEHSYLITATLRLAKGTEVKDAQYVAKAWRRFLYRLQLHGKNQEMAWFRVTELTKQGQPHLHLVVGGIGERRAHCEKRPHPYNAVWRTKNCECIEHEWSRAWFLATGDSFVVNAETVLGAAGAAAYLGKYLRKNMVVRNRLAELGFERRFSRSRNWPGGGLQLQATVDKAWGTIDFIFNGSAFAPVAKEWIEWDDSFPDEHPLLVRTGTDLALKLADKHARKTLKRRVKRLVANLSTHTRPPSSVE